MTDLPDLPPATNVRQLAVMVSEEEKQRWLRGRGDGPLPPERMSLEEMRQRCVMIPHTSEVVVLPPPLLEQGGKALRPMSISNWETANKHLFTVVADEEGNERNVQTTKLWLLDSTKLVSDDYAFAIGRPRYFVNTAAGVSLNLWTPYKRPAVCDADLEPIFSHISYLIPEERLRNIFYDWLAHTEQVPEENAKWGWLFITEGYGVGRSLMGELFANVWKYETINNLDLASILKSGFNEQLSGKRMAVVDEMYVGEGHENRDAAANFRAMITATVRHINPKYGKKYVEYNALRFLLFANDVNALPLPDGDRRIAAVMTPAERKSDDYYIQLARCVHDNRVGEAFGIWLRSRNISKYNAGALPPDTDIKAEIQESSKTETEREVRAVLRAWVKEGVDAFAISDLEYVVAAAMGRRPSRVALGKVAKKLGWSLVSPEGIMFNYGKEKVWKRLPGLFETIDRIQGAAIQEAVGERKFASMVEGEVGPQGWTLTQPGRNEVARSYVTKLREHGNPLEKLGDGDPGAF